MCVDRKQWSVTQYEEVINGSQLSAGETMISDFNVRNVIIQTKWVHPIYFSPGSALNSRTPQWVILVDPSDRNNHISK